MGKLDFWHTLAYKNAAIMEGLFPMPEAPDVRLPENIWYVSLKNSREDVLTDIGARFSEDFFEVYSKHVKFVDFIPEYFSIKRSAFDMEEGDRTELELAAPSVFARVMEKASAEGEEPGHIFKLFGKISDFIRGKAKNSIVLLESLNELIRAAPGEDERGLLSSLLYLRRENSTKWGSVIFTYLSEGIFAKHIEESATSTIDNVLTFESETIAGGGRVVKIRKLRGQSSGVIGDTRFELYPTPHGVDIMKIDLLDV